MSKRTLFLIFALFIIASTLLAVALYKPSLNPTLTILPTPTPKELVGQTSLIFGSPLLSSSAASLSYSLPINIATGTNKVTAVQLELQYDPLILTNISVSPGSFFQNPVVLLNQIDTKTGRISYAFGINPTDQGVAGQGTVAILNFKALTSEKTAIIFLPKTLVAAEGTTQSVLKTTINATFTLEKLSSTPPNSSSPSAQ
ncbi:MAG: hypothetical protein HY424_01875 [Candidatus Levybacteria bacterium]|nr:hypothetical protein [Candidatus Levybacteria bacterium]